MSGGEDSEQLKRLSGTEGVPPAKRRGRAIFRKSSSTITFALRAHYGRDARGPGQSLDAGLTSEQIDRTKTANWSRYGNGSDRR
jgi:hypothetical protein